MNDLPLIRVEKGYPDEAELAALLTVLTQTVDTSTEPQNQHPATVRWIHPERRIAFVAHHSWMAA